MNLPIRRLLLPLLLLLPALVSAQFPSREPLPPLATILDPQGLLRLDGVTRGVFDARGYELVDDPSGRVRVVRSERARAVAAIGRSSSDANGPSMSMAAPDDDRWDNRFGAASSVDLASIYVVAVDGGNVYIGGNFGRAGDVDARNIARWNNGAWSALGAGINGPVFAIGFSGSEVYAGGSFDSAGSAQVNNIARWTGSEWTAMGDQLINGVGSPNFDIVYAIVAGGDDVYVGGFFDRAGDKNVGNLARWNRGSNAWSALNDDELNGVFGEVYALVLDGQDLYVGGGFVQAGGMNAGNIAKWNVASREWTTLNGGVDGVVRTMAFAAGKLYVGGGTITSAGGVEVRRIAVWDIAAGAWSPLGGDPANTVNGRVTSMVANGANLYIAGEFVRAGSTDALNIARWDGQRWNALDGGIDGGVDYLAFGGSTLYAAGQFVVAGTAEARYVAQWNGSAWSGLGGGGGLGSGASIAGIAVDGVDTYVGGVFLTAGSVNASNVAVWNKSSNTWSALGTGGVSGVNGPVSAVARASNGDLYVAGLFTKAGTVPALNVARWNKSTNSWSALGDGVEGLIRSIVARGDDLYVAGSFVLPLDGDTAYGVARWNSATSSWSALGDGPHKIFENFGAVDIAFGGDTLYAAGSYATVIGAAYGVVRWNGFEWASILDNVSGETQSISISAMTADAGNVYVALSLLTTDEPVGSVLRRNSVTGAWAPVGGAADSVDGLIKDLAIDDGAIHIGGSFATRAENPIRNIAWWNSQTSSWEGLGSGTNGEINVITVGNRDVNVGGTFTSAGAKPSRYLGIYHRASASVEWTRLQAEHSVAINAYPNPAVGPATIAFRMARAGLVTLEIMTPSGERVAVLRQGRMPAGEHEARWETAGLPTGLYLCRVTLDGATATVPVIVAK